MVATMKTAFHLTTKLLDELFLQLFE